MSSAPLHVRLRRASSANRGGLKAEFTLPAGFSLTVLFGPSACGKTSLLRCLAGLEDADDGEIRFGDELWFSPTKRLQTAQRRIGLVAQQPALFPHLTVGGNLQFALAREPRAAKAGALAALVERFELGHLVGRSPQSLSGGERQRVALAQSLATKPRLLMLDEPFSALDSATRTALHRSLRGWLAELDAPVLLVTHDRDEALSLGDHLLVMQDGEMLAHGPAQQLFRTPGDERVGQILGVDSLLTGVITDAKGPVATARIGHVDLFSVSALPVGTAVCAMIRAEDVVLGGRETGATTARNQLFGRITAVFANSRGYRVEIDCGFALVAQITASAWEDFGFRSGGEVTALIKASSVHLIAKP